MKKLFLSIMLTVLLTSIILCQYVEPIRELEVPPAFHFIYMDGIAEDVYSEMQETTIAKREGVPIEQYEQGDDFDFNARFSVCWDSHYLYVFMEITDDNDDHYVRGKAEGWTWDNVEIYVQLDTNSFQSEYSDSGPTQIRICPGLKALDGSDSIVEYNTFGQIEKFKSFLLETEDGWNVEIGIPWSATTNKDTIDYDYLSTRTIGFDISFADSDGDGSEITGDRNTNGEGGAQAFWDLDTSDPLEGLEDRAYENPLVFGMLYLQGSGWHTVPEPDFIANQPQESRLDCYPNPVNTSFRIKAYTGPIQLSTIEGKTVLQQEYTGQSIDMSELPAGIYILKTRTGIQKLVKE